MARNVTSKFGVTDGLDFTSEQGITSISLDKLIPYHNHRFTLYEGERLEDMIQSIKKNGVITPIIVRTANGGKYEILSGHNRVYAAGQAGLENVPAVVKVNLSDEDAEIFVVETNLIQRGFSDLKISEQAFAVALRYNKLFDERKRKEICDELYFIENGKHRPEDVPPEHLTTRDATAEEYGISSATVARLLRIDKMINEFKVLVDRGNIKVRSAVDLSYLTEEQLAEYDMEIHDSITSEVTGTFGYRQDGSYGMVNYDTPIISQDNPVTFAWIGRENNNELFANTVRMKMKNTVDADYGDVEPGVFLYDVIHPNEDTITE